MFDTSFALELTEHFRALKNDSSLKDHQLFVVDYLKNHSGLLVKHDLGTGKSLIMAAILADQLDQVIFLSAKSLHSNMQNAIEKYAEMTGKQIDTDYAFVTMNASNMIEQIKKTAEKNLTIKFETAAKINLDNKCLIVDEAHNLFNSITNGSKNAVALYKAIMKAQRLKVVFMTGTPIVNDPFELVPCFNMIARSEVLPTNYEEFNKFFVDVAGVKNKDKFKNRIFGLVSYYGNFYGIKSNDEDFPKSLKIIFERVHMTEYQFQWYSVARDLELEESSRSAGAKIQNLQKPRGLFTSSYKRLSRQISNIIYPTHAISTASRHIKLLADKVTDEDFDNLQLYSPKLLKIYDNIMDKKNEGKHLFYSSFVESGVNMFARFLLRQGWTEKTIEGKLVSRGKNLRQQEEHDDEIDEIILDNGDEEFLDQLNPSRKPSRDKETADTDETNLASELTTPTNNATENSTIPIDEGIKDEDDDVVVAMDASAMPVDNSATPAEDSAIPAGDDMSMDNEIVDDNSIREPTATGGKVLSKKMAKKLVKKTEKADKAEKVKSAAASVKKPIVYPKEPKLPKNTKSNKDQGAVNKKANKDLVFVRVTGEVPSEIRQQLITLINSESNTMGEEIKLIMISGAGAEGLDLSCIRFIHICEGYWNWMRIKQVIGRGVRYKSHITLPLKLRTVQPFIYLSDYPANIDKLNKLYASEKTTDITLIEKAANMNKIINDFYFTIAEAAIDCGVHNQNKNLKCNICMPTGEPLYIEDINKDMLVRSPCQPYEKKEIQAREITIDDKKYAISGDQLLEFRPELDGYVEITRDNPIYNELLKLKK